MFGPLLLIKELHLFTPIAKVFLILDNIFELITYIAAILAIVGICIKLDIFFVICTMTFAISLILWKINGRVLANPDGKIKHIYYK